MSRTWAVPSKRWNGCNILQLFRAQTRNICVKSAVIVVSFKSNCLYSCNSHSASRPRNLQHTQIVLSVFVLLFCTVIAPSDDIALTISVHSWLETFTISGLIKFAL